MLEVEVYARQVIGIFHRHAICKTDDKSSVICMMTGVCMIAYRRIYTPDVYFP